MKVKQTYVYSCYEGVKFRQSLSTYTRARARLLRSVAIRQKLRELYLYSNLPSRLHLGNQALHAKSL